MFYLILIILAVLSIIVLYMYFKQEPLPHNTVLAFVGTMGSGKTFLAVRSAIRCYKRQRLCRFFCRCIPPLRLFFPKWNRVPVIYSNIPIKLGRNKYSKVLRREHLLRERLLPEGAIVVIDEIGQFASQWDYENPLVREELADLTRFFRHWIDGRMFITDQSSDNIVKQIRCRLGLIYHLNDFHRWFLLPFFKVECTPLLMVEDTKRDESVNVDILDRSYFFGLLHYRWFSKLLKLARYDSRCYSSIYRYGATRQPFPYDSTLKTRYLIDISVSQTVSKDYKLNKNKYKDYLYHSCTEAEGDSGEAGGSPVPPASEGGSPPSLS